MSLIIVICLKNMLVYTNGLILKARLETLDQVLADLDPAPVPIPGSEGSPQRNWAGASGPSVERPVAAAAAPVTVPTAPSICPCCLLPPSELPQSPAPSTDQDGTGTQPPAPGPAAN